MGYASRSGRAQTSARNPRAFGVCDRCGIWYNHDQLKWQMDWAGAALINKRILVCSSCMDVPQQQLRAIVIPADPTPIMNPRVESYVADEVDKRQVSGYNTINARTGIPVPGGDIRATSTDGVESGVRVIQQTGGANGSVNQEPGTDPNAPGNDDPGLPIGNVDVPKTGNLSPPYNVVWYNGALIEVNWLNTGGVFVNWQIP
jgi:hypothetical protein